MRRQVYSAVRAKGGPWTRPLSRWPQYHRPKMQPTQRPVREDRRQERGHECRTPPAKPASDNAYREISEDRSVQVFKETIVRRGSVMRRSHRPPGKGRRGMMVG